MSDNITKRVGLGTAYGFAKAGGYEGTVAEFTELLGNIAIDLARIENLSVTVTTLPAGSQATASLNGSVLSLGIPKGDKGDKGNTGETGAPAGFGTVSATVDDNIGTPSVEVTASGADTAKNFAFAFHNLKGQKGDKGDTGDVTLSQLEDFTVVQTDENVEPYNFRATPKCGHIERLKKVVGGTVAWNQYAKKLNSENWVAESGATATFGDGIVELTSETLNNGVKNATATGASSVTGHRYLVMMDAKISDGTENPAITFIGSGQAAFTCSFRLTETMSSYGKIVTANKDNSIVIYVFPSESRSLNKTITLKNIAVYDLTQMFGSTIADYIYGLEQANAGAGVAWFKKHFPKPYYEYNTGQLMSVKALRHITRGFNAWDEEWEVGGISAIDGTNDASATTIRSKNYISVLPNTAYYVKWPWAGNVRTRFYDADKNYLGYVQKDGTAVQHDSIFTTPDNCHYMRFQTPDSTGTTYDPSTKPICINLSWDGERDGEYEEYSEHVYELDSDLELRGVPKLSAGNDLYYDGDVYEPDGTVTRKYGIVDLGTLTWTYKTNPDGKERMEAELPYETIGCGQSSLIYPKFISSKYDVVPFSHLYNHMQDKVIGSWSETSGVPTKVVLVYDSAYTDATVFKTAMSGVHLVYELATPTTETADPFTENQICEAGGTEEFVSTSIVPIGHETEYPLTLSDIRPTANGNYVLKCTVSNGKASYEWVSA